MIALLILAVYVVGYVPTTAALMRHYAGTLRPGCPMGNSANFCSLHHRAEHREPIGLTGQALVFASLEGLLWPFLLLPMTALWLARREPLRAELDASRVNLQAEIEKAEAHLRRTGGFIG